VVGAGMDRGLVNGARVAANVREVFDAKTGRTTRYNADGSVLSVRVDRRGIGGNRVVTHTNARGCYLVQIAPDRFCKLIVGQQIIGPGFDSSYWLDGEQTWTPFAHEDATEEVRQLAANLPIPERVVSGFELAFQNAGSHDVPDEDRLGPAVFRGGKQVSGKPREYDTAPNVSVGLSDAAGAPETGEVE
jgi:hypothetical protein